MSEDVGRDRRTIERAVIMHGTSRARLEAARTLARIVRESRGRGAAYGLTDTMASGRLAPVHTAAGGPCFKWSTALPRTFARRIDRAARGWQLEVRGADAERLDALGPLLSLAADKLEAADLHDRPTIPAQGTLGEEGRFLALLDAFRFVSFTLARPSDMLHVRVELEAATRSLPLAARGPAAAVADALHDLDRLSAALLAVDRVLEREGRLAPAAAGYVILYELALLRCDLAMGMDATHGAGRTFRKLTEWREALRWYELGLRLADHADDFLHATRVLDGLGNTHRERGAFPAARRCYRDASRLALVAGDPVEVGNVALGLMTVEREAGRLDAATKIGWRALRTQTDPRQRVNLLLNLGTLLRDGGALDLAEDAYRLVLHQAEGDAHDREVRLMAHDALAYCAALRGAATEYEERRAAVRSRSRGVSPYIRAQIGYFRGASLRALGDQRAARVLRATERYARAHGLKEWEVRSGALADKRVARPVPSVAALHAPEEVRSGIGALLATAGRAPATSSDL